MEMEIQKRHGSGMEMQMGTPWLDQPVMLHSSRTYSCSLNDTAKCEYQQGHWRFWYEADWHYALPTVAFFLTTIALFAIPFLLSPFFASTRRPLFNKIRSAARFLSYRQYRLNALNWNSAPLGVLLLGAVGAIYFFSMVLGPKPYYWPNVKAPNSTKLLVSWGGSPPIATRSGWLALGCLPFIMATSPKSNMITGSTGISHEKLQVFHRWISYACFVLALIHTFPFIVYNNWRGTLSSEWKTDMCYWTGVVALIAQAWLTFASIGPLRAMYYEFFKISHFIAAAVFVVFFFLHCDFRLSSWDYFIATGVIYTLCFLHSQLRVFFTHGMRKNATVSLTPNGFIRISIPTKTTWRAGQHYFLRFISLHAWTAHPFTACSLPTKAHYYEAASSSLIFYIRPQGGLTARLASYAAAHPNSKLRIMLDGPYGGIEMPKLESSHRTLVLAGGSGAGWTLPLIEAFLRRRDCADCCDNPNPKPGAECLPASEAPSMRVILATRDLATRNWFEESIAELLEAGMVNTCPTELSVEIFYTGEDETSRQQTLQTLDDPEKGVVAAVVKDVDGSGSDSGSERIAKTFSARDHSSRPDVKAIVAAEADLAREKSLGVFVCGPLSMQADVANAVANEQVQGMKGGEKDVYLHMEHFSWA